MSSKIYPIGIQNFESLRRDNYFYIDKTALIYQMVKTGRYYFLSRPRRFGKSLLVSTLEAYFLGKKELFTGLAMEKLEKDWIEYPILHLDLNIEKYDTPESLNNILENFTALIRPSVPFHCVLRELLSALVSRRANVSSSLWTSMINLCCKPSAMKPCNVSFAIC